MTTATIGSSKLRSNATSQPASTWASSSVKATISPVAARAAITGNVEPRPWFVEVMDSGIATHQPRRTVITGAVIYHDDFASLCYAVTTPCRQRARSGVRSRVQTTTEAVGSGRWRRASYHQLLPDRPGHSRQSCTQHGGRNMPVVNR